MAPIVRRKVSLRSLNSLHVDALADWLIEVRETDDLPAVVALLREHPAPLVLGGGSNVLFTRDPVAPVVHLASQGRRVVAESGDEAVVEASAGENWNSFVQWTLGLGLCGLENLSLIPGSVGASPIQNIGAYGVEMRERFESLDAVSLRNASQRRFDAADCRFAYRDSVFRHTDGAGWAITNVRFRLSRTPRLNLDYGEIRDELRAAGIVSPQPRDVARAVIAIRQRKLPDPDRIGNVGSFFRNPVVDAAVVRQLSARFPEMPVYPVRPGAASAPDGKRAKLSAGWLIERCGWKGHRDGDAGVHEAHALVLVNHGAATGAQIAALAERIRASVRTRFGVELEPEPTIA